MNIEKDTPIAVVVTREWVNRRGVRLFIREGREIPKEADSHIILGNVLDANDARGLWMESKRGGQSQLPANQPMGIMIPWNCILCIVIRQDLSPELWDEARKIGFVTGG